MDIVADNAPSLLGKLLALEEAAVWRVFFFFNLVL
jgi:hypothetical protein